MMYYVFLSMIDIGIFIKDNWQELTFTVVASGIGMILGKRIGSRMAINYILKIMGLHKKSIIDQKVDWLISQEEARGNHWSLQPNGLKKVSIPIFKKPYFSLHRVTKQASQLKRRKKKMAKDILSGKKKIGVLILAVLINGVNDVFGLGLTEQTLDTATYIGGGYVAIEGILDIIRSFSNHFIKKQEIQTVAANEERSH